MGPVSLDMKAFARRITSVISPSVVRPARESALPLDAAATCSTRAASLFPLITSEGQGNSAASRPKFSTGHLLASPPAEGAMTT
jgi:hypothetical protein